VGYAEQAPNQLQRPDPADALGVSECCVKPSILHEAHVVLVEPLYLIEWEQDDDGTPSGPVLTCPYADVSSIVLQWAGMGTRFSFEPLERHLRAIGCTNIGATLGASSVTIKQARAGGLTLRTADRWATRLGLHPMEIWGDEYWDYDPGSEPRSEVDGQLELFGAA
jgi:hypothetical protein